MIVSTGTQWEGLTPPYATIVADPPWDYGSTFTPKPPGDEWQKGSAAPYSVMADDELLDLPVKELAAPNAHLYLWTTNGFLERTYGIARAWGFTPKTLLTWTKVHQDDPERVSMKTGYYFRGATEHVLFGVRGSLRLQCAEGLPTGYLWPRIKAHSRKPQAFFDLVEKASPGPYVELFARSPRLGWDSWGYGYEGVA